MNRDDLPPAECFPATDGRCCTGAAAQANHVYLPDDAAPDRWTLVCTAGSGTWVSFMRAP